MKLISLHNGLLYRGKSNQRAGIFWKSRADLSFLYTSLAHRVIVKTSLTELLLMKKTNENFLIVHFRWIKTQMTSQSDVQGKFLRMKLFKNNQKSLAKVWQSVRIVADTEHFNRTISHFIWIQKQRYAKAFLERERCNLIPIHCLFTHKHFCAYEKSLCEAHTHTSFCFFPQTVHRELLSWSASGLEKQPTWATSWKCPENMTGEIHFGSHESLTCILLLQHQQANILRFWVFRNHQSSSFRFCGAAGLRDAHSTGEPKTIFLLLLVR